MSKKLLIVESPSKAKTIGKYVGDGYVVKASVGHVRDLPKSNKKAIDIEGGFVPHYEVPEEKQKVVSDLKSAAKSASEVLLATDPDREGEAIAWHVAELLDLKKKPKRVVFHEITERAVKEALEHPREIDYKLVEAQEARRVLDRLVGYDLSGLIWKKIRYGLSAGRVQSPALRILVEREREIRAFKPEDFWVITADLKGSKGSALSFLCEEKPTTEKEADRIVAEGTKGAWHVLSVEEAEGTRKPKAPFTTSTLQQAASSRLGYSPSQTMRLAQKLYEAGHITYMRTDSTNLSKDAVSAITSLVQKKFGEKYSKPQQYATKSKNAQEAHEAIRPTSVETAVAGSSDQEKKVYKLIWQRAMASQMADAKVIKTTVVANIKGASIPNFSVSGSRTVFDGWLAADQGAKADDVELPKMEKGDALALEKISHEHKQTEPPHRYSEAGLVKELEKRGIGRPSTYASIIQTILARNYVEKIERSLKPTDTGEVVSEFLETHFKNIVSDSFTAEMEENLDDIARGEKEYIKTLKDFYGPFTKEVKEGNKAEKATTLGDAPEDVICPVCSGKMVIKLGRTGKFYSCAKFPDCDGARTMEGVAMEKPHETGEECPECKKGKLVERGGKFGTFIACGRYPKCKFIKKDEEAEKARLLKMDTGVTCTECKKGTMLERKGRFGLFYSCSNYPDCKLAIKAKPTGDICKICNSLMMEGTKTIPTRCSNKACENHKPPRVSAK